MYDFEVEIAGRPLGVKFAHAGHGETVVVHLVLEGELGAKLGLEPGDVLIAINGKTLLNKTSAQALEEFRSQVIPYKATFRRFDEDDEYEDNDDDDDDEDENDENNASKKGAMIREEVDHLMVGLQANPKSDKNIPLKDWTVEDVLAWLSNYGRTLRTPERFDKYHPLFREHKVDGNVLRGLDRIDLAKLGVNDDDAHDLFIGIRELNNIVQVPSTTTTNTKKDIDLEGSDEEDGGGGGGDAGDDEEEVGAGGGGDGGEDVKEAPFLPYMNDAPSVKLSSKISVKVESARVVQPFNKRAFALYELWVTEGDNEWILSKRYNEFHKLHREMRKLGIRPKAKFPGKGILKGSTDSKVIEERQQKLTKYLNCLLTDHPEAKTSRILNDFLSPSRTFVVDQ